MQKQHLNQAIAGITAASLLVAQVPTAALAEALDEQGQAPVEQTQATEPAESPAEGGSQQEASGQGAATQKDAPAQKDTEKSDDGTDEAADAATPEAPAADEPAAPTQVVTSTTDKVADGQAADADDGVAVYASQTLSFHGNDLTKKDVYSFVSENFGQKGVYRIKGPGTSGSWQDISSWNLIGPSDPAGLAPGSYEVQYRSWTSWKSCGTLALERYWNATASVSGCPTGAVVVNGSELANGGSARITEGAAASFAVKKVADFKVASVKVNGQDATPAADGSYTLPSDADSAIEVAYQASNSATLTAQTDGHVKSLTVLGTSFSDGETKDVTAKLEGTAQVVPEDGYAVTSVALVDADGAETPLTLGFSNHEATADLPALAKDASYTLKVTTAKAGLKGIDGAKVAVAGRADRASYKDIVFNAAFDAQGSVPAGLTADDVAIQYNAGGTAGWKDLDYEPGTWDKLLGAHAFGEKGVGATEKIRISYAGDDQYPGSSIDLSVTVDDARPTTHLSMNSSTTVQYDADEAAMRRKVLDQLAVSVIDDSTGKPVSGLTADDFELSGLEHAAGDYTVTVKFKGTSGEHGYRPSEATAAVTVAKAPASVKVSNASITYGETVSVDQLVSSTPGNAETEPIVVIAGVDGDARGFLSVDLSNIGNGTVQSLINGAFHLDQGVTLDGLVDIVSNDSAMAALKFALKMAGVGNADEIVSDLRTVLTQLQSLGLGSSVVALGATPRNAGVYAVGAVSTSGNYETSYDLGYLTIAPQAANIELRWNAELPQGNMSYEQAQGFDFGAGAYGSDGAVAANVKLLFAGVTASGKAYLSQEAPTEPGAYTETASILGGNYFAAPAVRSFVIGRAQTAVQLADARFEYDGAPQGQQATVTDEAGNALDGAEVVYTYAGVTASGKVYAKANQAPTEAGTYRVWAVYAGTGLYGSSSASALLAIGPREVEATVADAQKISGQTDPAFTCGDVVDKGQSEWRGAVSVAEAVGASISLTRAAGEEPGQYQITGTASRVSKNFSLTVNPGTLTIDPSLTMAEPDGHGTAKSYGDGGAAGTRVRIVAEPESDSYVFTGWTVTSGDATVEDPTSADTYVEMGTENSTVTAHFALKWTPVDPDTTKYKVSVEATEGGQATSDPHGAKAGQTVKVSATADDGYDFKGWEVVSGDVELADASSAQTSFTMGRQPVLLRAVFERKPGAEKIGVKVLAGTGGTVSYDPSSAASGETVTIAATPGDGYEFDYWEVLAGDVVLADARSQTTTFAMGTEQPTIKAHFKAKKATAFLTGNAEAKDGAQAAEKNGVAKQGDLAQTGDQSVNVLPIAVAGVAVVAVAAVCTAIWKRRRK